MAQSLLTIPPVLVNAVLAQPHGFYKLQQMAMKSSAPVRRPAILILRERRFEIGLKRSEMQTVPAFSRSKAGCKPALRTKMR
ncbi:MAG TPA: hypothetical protein PKA41_08440, partial [Verrucomicrobiota bacterium]|nr:hypothetical protein [Verrucomicrobiota bacterium]